MHEATSVEKCRINKMSQLLPHSGSRAHMFNFSVTSASYHSHDTNIRQHDSSCGVLHCSNSLRSEGSERYLQLLCHKWCHNAGPHSSSFLSFTLQLYSGAHLLSSLKDNKYGSRRPPPNLLPRQNGTQCQTHPR